jgi:hypothetical protein
MSLRMFIGMYIRKFNKMYFGMSNNVTIIPSLILVHIIVFNDLKNQAMKIMFLSMKNDIIYYIIDQDEPSACWTMLQHLFETKK